MKENIGLDISSKGDIGIVAFQATTISDAEGISSAANQIKDFITQKKPLSLVFDFEKVKFFSSQVLGLLLDVRSKLDSEKGKVVISAIEPQLHRVFTITNLDKIFSFYPDKDSAVSSIQTG